MGTAAKGKGAGETEQNENIFFACLEIGML
jgi:hypothetical protein